MSPASGAATGGRRRRRAGGRRGESDDLVVIYWRDIPAQVNAGAGTAKVQRILPRRFQRAIDNAAMVAGLSNASQYIGEWRRVARAGDGDDLEGAALRAAAELEAAFPRERLETYVETGGWDPDRTGPMPGDGAADSNTHEQEDLT